MDHHTTDLSDEHPEFQVAEPVFRDFGGRARFQGAIQTVIAPEDNTLVRSLLETPGDGRVLVVDGMASTRCALVGGNLGELAVENDWRGVIVNGCVRDTAELAALDVGVKALAQMPRRSGKHGWGSVGSTVTFAGVVFRPGDWLVADEDGIVVAPEPPA